jgi:hypothetical protein
LRPFGGDFAPFADGGVGEPQRLGDPGKPPAWGEESLQGFVSFWHKYAIPPSTYFYNISISPVD